MKIATVAGTRPEWIRLSKLIPLLDSLLGNGHRLVHTGQNFSPELDANLFAELDLRRPDLRIESGGESFANQFAVLMPALEDFLARERPDRMVILGDTNSSLGAAIVAARLGIAIYHVESGNRCHGHQSPEEVNRRVIDHTSTVHLCYSERARMNLVAEGLPLARTFVVGNPLAEVLASEFSIEGEPTPWQSKTWDMVGLSGPGMRFLSTMHRAENVDDQARLWAFLNALQAACEGENAMCLMSTHPRMRARLNGTEAAWNRIVFSRPLPFRQFVAMEATADLVLSDSGTAPEECAILARPLVILRDYMERQEVLERGGAVLWAPGYPVSLWMAVRSVMDRSGLPAPIPPEYSVRPVAATVARLLLSPVPPC